MLPTRAIGRILEADLKFQWAPTLGGECYQLERDGAAYDEARRFNGHPPLGVNATITDRVRELLSDTGVSMGTHPWG